jgi:hypothetical protein
MKETDIWAEFWQKSTIRQKFFLKSVRQKDFSTGGREKHSGMHDDMD